MRKGSRVDWLVMQILLEQKRKQENQKQTLNKNEN